MILSRRDAGIGAEQIDAAHFSVALATIDLTCSKFETSAASAIATPTGFVDFLDHGFRGRQRPAGTVAGAAEIIDHDLCAPAGQSQRMGAPRDHCPRR